MKEFTIDKNCDGMRLDKFMSKVMPSVGQGGIYKALRKKKVRVNGKHTDASHRLSLGDKVCMYINDEFFVSSSDASEFLWAKAPSQISIVYEDDNILIADKPSGMPSQDIDGEKDSLESRIRSYLLRKGEITTASAKLFLPSLCHRLDRNTAGLVIAAKNGTALRSVNEKIKNREIKKFYLCQCEVTPSPKKGKVSGWLLRDEKSRKTRFYGSNPGKNAQFSETLYRTVTSGAPATVEVELLTGRTHQIRSVMAHIGAPLSGDVKYGAHTNDKRSFQALCAYKLKFDFTTFDENIDYLNGKEFSLSVREF